MVSPPKRLPRTRATRVRGVCTSYRVWNEETAQPPRDCNVVCIAPAVELADPDVAGLQRERLVELVATAVDATEFKLTSEGVELITRLGSMKGDA